MEDLYFKSEEVKIIFGLVELSGKTQMDFLKISMEHYTNKEKAQNWYLGIKEKISGRKHPKLDVALINLEKLYKGME